MQETPYVIDVQKNAPIIPDEEAPLQSPMAIYIYTSLAIILLSDQEVLKKLKSKKSKRRQ